MQADDDRRDPADIGNRGRQRPPARAILIVEPSTLDGPARQDPRDQDDNGDEAPYRIEQRAKILHACKQGEGDQHAVEDYVKSDELSSPGPTCQIEIGRATSRK